MFARKISLDKTAALEQEKSPGAPAEQPPAMALEGALAKTYLLVDGRRRRVPHARRARDLDPADARAALLCPDREPTRHRLARDVERRRLREDRTLSLGARERGFRRDRHQARHAQKP